MEKKRSRTPWWVAFATVFVLLALLDGLLRLWSPHPARFAENFSPAYLNRVAGALADRKNLIIVMGDSVVRGYHIRENETAVALLRERFAHYEVINLAFDGGSVTNSELLLRYLLWRGVHPRLVVFNVNMKEFNPADNAYVRIHPALGVAASGVLTETDRHALQFAPVGGDLNSQLGIFMERCWAFYAYRVDLRMRIFGTDDMASALSDEAAYLAGSAQRKEALHRVTAQRFFATYDLTPLDSTNVAYQRLASLGSTLRRERIPAIAFITPTNHQLLHAYIDNPDYVYNVKQVERLLRSYRVRVSNLDAAIPAQEFIDNDHMTPSGNLRLANLLAPRIRSALK